MLASKKPPVEPDCYDIQQSSGLRYQKLSTPLYLNKYIEHIWTLRVNADSKVRREILVPTGRPGIVISLGEPCVRTDSLTGHAYHDTAMYYSLTTRPFVIEQRGRAYYVGVEFKPYGLATLIKTPYKTNHVGSLGELFDEVAVDDLISTLSSRETSLAAAQHLGDFLAGQIHPLPPLDLERLIASITLIEKQDGHIRVTELADEVHTSPSTLRRLFGRYIGTSPEQFIGVVRYASFVKSLMQSREAPHLLAALHGYYDEAHAAKDFKKYTGLSKKAFLHAYDNLARITHQE